MNPTRDITKVGISEELNSVLYSRILSTNRSGEKIYSMTALLMTSCRFCCSVSSNMSSTGTLDDLDGSGRKKIVVTPRATVVIPFSRLGILVVSVVRD